jgi:hypothetical protein
VGGFFFFFCLSYEKTVVLTKLAQKQKKLKSSSLVALKPSFAPTLWGGPSYKYYNYCGCLPKALNTAHPKTASLYIPL